MGVRVFSMLGWLALYWWLVSGTGYWAGLRTLPRAVWRNLPSLALISVATGTAGHLLWFLPSFAFGDSSSNATYTLIQAITLYPYYGAEMALALFATLWLLLILNHCREAAAPAGTMPYTA